MFYVKFYPVGDERSSHAIAFESEAARADFIKKNKGFWFRYTTYVR